MRKDISTIKIGGFEKSATDELIIEKDKPIEIYFSTPTKTLESFFDEFLDNNTAYIKSVDMSNFDASLVTSFAFLFYQCSALEEFIQPVKGTPSLTSLESMFEGCSSIIKVDLTKLNTENVINMDALFYGCSNLHYIIMSNLNLGKVETAQIMLEGIGYFDYGHYYLDLKDSNLTDAIFMNLFKNERLYTCLGLPKSDYNEICCNYDEEDLFCYGYGGFSVTYRIDDESHQFSTICEEGFNDIGFIAVNETIYYSKNQKFPVNKNSEIGIAFYRPVKNLSHFFYKNENISKVVLHLFYGEEPELNNMEYAFAMCKYLKSFSLVGYIQPIYLNNLFDSCTSLMSIDISGINSVNAVQYDLMFKDVNSLVYLDIEPSQQNIIVQIPQYYNNFIKEIGIERPNTLEILFKENVVFEPDFNLKYRANIHFMEIRRYRPPKYVIGRLNPPEYVIGRQDPPKKVPTFGDFTVKKGYSLVFHFFSPLDSLEGFFDNDQNDYTDKIISVSFSLFDFSKVTSFEKMFHKCNSLQYIYIPNINLTQVTNMKSMFEQCWSLIYANFSNVQFTENELDMSRMFFNCSSLKVLDLSNTTIKNALSDNMLNGVYLGYLNISESKINTSILSKFDSTLNYASILCKSKTDSTFKCKYCVEDCVDFDIEDNNVIGENYISVYYSQQFSFFPECDYPTKSDIKYIKFESLRYDKDSKVSSFLIPDNTKIELHYGPNVKSLDDLFKQNNNCGFKGDRLISIDFSHFNLSSVETMNGMFSGCTELTSIDFSNIKFNSLLNMSYIFSGCTKLKTVNLSGMQAPYLYKIEGMFNGCTSLKIMLLNDVSVNENINVKLVSNNIVNGVVGLDYLSIVNSKFPSLTVETINEIKAIVKNAIVCGSLEKNTNHEYFSICCDNDFNNGKCELSRYGYMTIYFKEGTNSLNTFKLKRPYEDKIILIYKDNKEYINLDESNSIKEIETSLKIYLSDDIRRLDNFFKGMTNIESVDLSHLKINNLTSTSNMFSGCTSLKYVNLTNFPTHLFLNNIAYMFSGCTALESIDLTYFLNASETNVYINMNSLFKNCRSLTSIIFPKKNIIRVSNMNSTFARCSNLESLDLPNFNILSGTDLTSVFSQCTSLKYLSLSYFNIDERTVTKNMFDGINSLEYLDLYGIKLNDSINQKDILNSLNTIDNLIVCQNEEIITNKNAQKVCCYYDTNKKTCEYYNYIILHYGKSVNYTNGFENEARKGISFIIHIDHELKIKPNETFTVEPEIKLIIYFSEPLSSLKGFFSSEFDTNAKFITSIDFSHFDSSKVTNMNSMFLGCTSLKSIDLKGLNTSSVIDMKKMFYKCKNLINVSLNDFNMSSVTDISSMFSTCTSLETNNLFTNKAKSLINLEKVFYKCENVKEINLNNFNTTNVDNMNELFFGCNSLNSLYVSNFEMKNCEKYENMFTNIKNIHYINLMNVKNDKIFAQNFNNRTFLVVCQEEKIITNPNATYCCNYNFTTKECQDVMETTIIQYSTTNVETISTTNIDAKIETTQYITESHINETIKNTIIKTTTIPTNELKVINIDISLILIGFSHFRNLLNKINFYIYFNCKNELFYSKGLKFPVDIETNIVLRMLQTYDAICEFKEANKKNIFTYFCEVDAQILNLKSIKIANIKELQFTSSNASVSFEKVEINYSPLALIYANNIQYAIDYFDNLRNYSAFYTLDNSKIEKDEKLLSFNISGIIRGQKPNFKKVDINLITLSLSKNENKQKILKCSVIDIINDIYILNCIGNKNTSYDLQHASSIIVDEILMINFDENSVSKVSFEQESKDDKFDKLSKKSGGLSIGVKVAIIVASIAFCIGVIVTVIIIRKKINNKKEEDSTIDKLENK